jgi:hypothetical protein
MQPTKPRYLTSAEMADRIGASRRTVQRLAARLEIGERLGRDIHFTEADAAPLAAAFQGRPGAPDGNQFWRNRADLRPTRKRKTTVK